MAMGVRAFACQALGLVLLCWISSVQGSSIRVACTANNCTSTRIGEPCSNHTDCTAIAKSQCQNDTCQCIPGYISSNESTECVLQRMFDKCQISSDCSKVVADSYCHKDRTCRCPDGYMFTGSKCVARKLGDDCAKNSDCSDVMNNTRCVGTKCACANSYLKVGNTCRLRRLGDNCTRNAECNHEEGNFRICDKQKGHCLCAKGYRPTRNNKVGIVSCVKVKLGNRCSKLVDCSAIPHTKCGSDNRCQCIPEVGRRASANNETCEIIQLNDECLADAGCQHVNNSACVEGKCLCRSGYTEDVAGTLCRPLLLGDPCLLSSDCNIANALCNNNICSCMKGFAASNGSSECAERNVDETECSRSEDCLEHFPNTVCNSMGLCQCELKYYLSPSRGQCLFRYLGDVCSKDGECSDSVQLTKCENNICKCIDTHFPSADKTTCELKFLGGMSCRTSADCYLRVPHSRCDVGNSSTCSCNTGYVSNEAFDLCLEKRLNDSCSFDADCNTTNPNTFCSPITQRCECFPEFIATFPDGVDSSSAINIPSKPFCSRRKIGDQSCQSKDECSSAIANSTCGSCLDAPEGSSCLQRCNDFLNKTDVLDALNSSLSCPLQTCICERGFIDSSDGGRCERRKLRHSCRVDVDCSIMIPNSVCLAERDICYCAPGFREDGSDVCTRRKIGDRCVRVSDCEDAVTSSHCNFSGSTDQRVGACKCNSGYYEHSAGTECQKRQIGDSNCLVHTDCSDAVNNSYCRYQMCVCNIGYYRSYDHAQCNKRRLNDYCDADLDCSAVIPNGVCEHYKCICASGYYPDNGTECKKRDLNDDCTQVTDCSDAINNSTCIDSVCRCVSGFVAMGNDTCVRRKIYDSTCENLKDCADAVEHSSCRDGTCLCDTGYRPSRGGTVCLPRKLDDACGVTPDCLSVIENSNCVTGQCACMEGFDAYDNSSRCVARPIYIGDPCYFPEQCQRVDPASSCNVTHGHRRCLCPPLMFTALNSSACIMLPAGVGDPCTQHAHCKHIHSKSLCVNQRCTCSESYFVDSNKTTCHRDPERLGDFCQADEHCNKTMDYSMCEQNNSTCICVYGYTQDTARSCVERDTLPQYKAIDAPAPEICTKSDLKQKASSCTWTNSLCFVEEGVPEEQCRCDHRHARLFNSTQCVPIQTYELDLFLTRKAGRYDYLPLEFKLEYLTRKLEPYKEFADRITLDGLMKLFNETTSSSSLKDRYVASEVVRFQNLLEISQSKYKGVKATVLLHLTANYLDATPVEDIYNFIEENLNISDGLLGASALKVATPYRDAVVLRDYDECADRNDCAKDDANCINTLGSFMCVCKSKYEDVSKFKNLRPGRECKIRSTTAITSDLCSSDDCKTKWEFVGLTVTLFLLIVLAFITYEIIQRKKTFTARKLYEKFGTTKIRKLRQASMQRLQERKKRKKAENKTKKEEEKQKKEEFKREKSEKIRLKDEELKVKQEEKKRKDLEKKEAKRTQKAKSSNDVEWLGEEEDREPPSPALEIVHHASLPCPATPDDDSPTVGIGSLPGSVNTPEVEMIFPKIIASPIEESNV